VAMQIATRISSLAQEQKDAALLLGASRALACTQYFSAISRSHDNPRYVVFKSGTRER
jgi:hypothetical protein